MSAKREKALVPDQVMTEKELLRCLVDAAKECGWLCYHTFLSKWSRPGFPDLILVRDGVLLAFECKSAKGTVSEPQQTWLDALAQVRRVEARMVRPADLEAAYRALVEGKWANG